MPGMDTHSDLTVHILTCKCLYICATWGVLLESATLYMSHKTSLTLASLRWKEVDSSLDSNHQKWNPAEPLYLAGTSITLGYLAQIKFIFGGC